MRRIRVAERALRLAAEPSRQRYVCRSCLAAARQFHSTPAQQADNITFFKRIKESIFGKKKTQKELDRDQARGEEAEKSLAEGADEEDLSLTQPRRIQVKGVPQGVEYREARKIDPKKNPEYVPATKWDGLKKVGGAQWIKNRADRGEKYTGFSTPKQRQLDNAQWLQLIHHVSVEVLTLQAAGRNVLDASNAPPTNMKLTSKATISRDESGAPVLKYSQTEDKEVILGAIPRAVKGKQTKGMTLDKFSAEANTKSALADFTFSDPMVKLAILKRTMQLTGKRIPDMAMSNATSIRDIYTAFKKKEKPKKLREEPRVAKMSLELPNVKVYKNRRMTLHKEKQIGRWKLIAAELTSRGLPVSGRRWVNAKEGKHLHYK